MATYLSPPPERLQDAVREAFRLESGFVFLNHGSFGAVPRPVELVAQSWRERLEARPIEMLGRNIYTLLAEAKVPLGAYIGADPARIGLVTNATSGIGAALRSMPWQRGDRIVVTNHGYNAVRQAVHAIGERFGTSLSVVDIPLPLGTADSIVHKIMSAVDSRTRLVIVDHITSPTALILPVNEIATACRNAGVRCIIDGAHAPGMIPLSIDAIGADWYTGNLHKWVCAPKGSAILVASPEVAPWTHPETTSHFHGHGFAQEFDWQGTRDYSGWLAIPAAIEFIESAGHHAIMRRNHDLAVWAHEMMCKEFGSDPICTHAGTQLGSMAAVRLPAGISARYESAAAFQARLYSRWKIEVPIIDWGGNWMVRVSAQAYNSSDDYLALVEAVGAELAGGSVAAGG